MTNRYEYYDVTDDGGGQSLGSVLVGQAFTIGTVGSNENFYLTKAQAKLYRFNDPGSVLFYVAHAVNSVKSGAYLGSISFAGSLIPVNSATWIEFEFLGSPILHKDTQYVLIGANPSGYGLFNHATWYAASYGEGSYIGGAKTRSTDGGDTWGYPGGSEGWFGLLFDTYGETILTPTATGYMRYANAGTNYNLRLITSGDAVTYNDDQTVRVNQGGVYCADMVSGTDADASGVFIKTPKGTKSWRTGS